MKSLILILSMVFFASFAHGALGVKTVTLLDAVTSTGASTTNNKILNTNRTFFAVGTVTAGAGSATILIQASNDNSNWILLDTISLQIASSASAGIGAYIDTSAWKYIRANVSAISGTDATVTVTAGSAI